MSLNKYISTGYYVLDCHNGQAPVTGSGVYTSFLDLCDAQGKSYILAINDATRLRLLNPCLSPATTTTTTTTTTNTTTLPPQNLFPSGLPPYSWTGNFIGSTGFYYDITAWGDTQGYLSGKLPFESGQYFTNISANDLNGFGTVLAVMKNGRITGFGDNSKGLLNIPNVIDAIQVSVGYDHCLVLRGVSGLVTGWGNDQWGALNITKGLTGVTKVCAGMGSSYFLLGDRNGYITGNGIVQGVNQINIPYVTGVKNISHSYSHILFLDFNGYLSGFGLSSFNENNRVGLFKTSNIFAGINANTIAYNNGSTSGYGTDQANRFTPSLFNAIDIQLKSHVGTSLKNDQSIFTWVHPYEGETYKAVPPSYVQNNVVSISQASNFTAAIIKRPCNPAAPASLTGYSMLWQLTGMTSGLSSFGGLSVGALYPPSSVVTQLCDCFSFSLPSISTIGQQFSQNLSNCNVYAGNHNVYFVSTGTNIKLININYNFGSDTPISTTFYKTGFAATGITTGDFWNNVNATSYAGGFNLKYSDGSQSFISGGLLDIVSLPDETLASDHFTSFDHMYATYSIDANISFPSRIPIRLANIPDGQYVIFVYAHGPHSGDSSEVSMYRDGLWKGTKNTSNDPSYNSLPWRENIQYVKFNDSINSNNNVVIYSKYFINGLQLVKVG